MGNFRFAALVMALFALTFVGVTWAKKGLSTLPLQAGPSEPVPAAPTAAVQAAPEPHQQAVHDSVTQDPHETLEPPQASDGDPRRETLRFEALAAAEAFSKSPCEPATKAKLIAALAAYAAAWSELAGCENGACGGDERKLVAAAAAFSTPADRRVRAALRAAFHKGGISRQDFPASVRLWVTMLVGDPGDPVSACAAGRRAEVGRSM